jgi:hypothetical protein
VGRRAGGSVGDGLGPCGEQGQPVLGVGELGQLRADQLVLRVAEEPGDRGRLIGDRQIGVDQGDQVGGVVHQCLEPRLALGLGRCDAEFTGPARRLEPAEQQAGHDRGEDHHEQGLGVGDHAGVAVGRLMPAGRVRHGGVQPARGRQQRRARGGPGCGRAGLLQEGGDPLDGVPLPRDRGGDALVVGRSRARSGDLRGGVGEPLGGRPERCRRNGCVGRDRAPQLGFLGRRRGVQVGQQHVGPRAGVRLVPQGDDAEAHAESDVEREDHRGPATPGTAPEPSGQLGRQTPAADGQRCGDRHGPAPSAFSLSDTGAGLPVGAPALQ